MTEPRHHLTILLHGPLADRLQLLRMRWDPVMARLVPPHVSVVYPEEIPDSEALVSRAAIAAAGLAPFRLTLGPVLARDEGRGGVFFAVDDPSHAWTEYRALLLAEARTPLDVLPHATVVHPRTSDRGPAALDALRHARIDGDVLVTEVCQTRTHPYTGMEVLHRFRLTGPYRHDCVAAVLRRDGRVLLAHRRADCNWYPDVWDLPGGHVDQGEDHRSALARELQEELGIVIYLPDAARPVRLDDADTTLRIWVIDQWDGEPRNIALDEHDHLAWFDRSDLPDLALASPKYRTLLREALST